MANTGNVNEASRLLVEAAAALGGTDVRRGGPGLLDVLHGRSPSASLSRAIVDMTRADAAGVLPTPQLLPLGLPSTRPLLAYAQPLVDRTGIPAQGLPKGMTYQVPQITSTPTVSTNRAEKTADPNVAKLTISTRSVTSDLCSIAIDESVQVQQRGDIAAAEQALALAVAAEAERKALARLATGLTAETDLVTAIAIAGRYGWPVLVLADQLGWPKVAPVVAPLMASMPGQIVLVPVNAATPSGSIVVAQANMRLYASDVQRLEESRPLQLGRDVALFYEILASWMIRPLPAWSRRRREPARLRVDGPQRQRARLGPGVPST
jgi:hypothetical protein